MGLAHPNADSTPNLYAARAHVAKDELTRFETADHTTEKKLSPDLPQQSLNDFLDVIRYYSPNVLVNESSRLNFGLRAIADALSIKSGLRPAILNDTALHAPYFRDNPNKIPAQHRAKGYHQGMNLGYASKDRAIAGGIVLSTLLMGTVFSEKAQTKEERDQFKDMPISHYIPMRIGHAFQPWKHITATVGLGTIANGAYMARSGFNQWSEFEHVMGALKGKNKLNWKMLPWEGMQGLMTMAAGSILEFMPDQERAWQISTLIFMNRIPIAAPQAWRAWKHGIPGKVDPGDWEQGGKFILNQTSNVFGLLYGGVKKEGDKIVRLKDEYEKPPEEPIFKDYATEHVSDAPFVLEHVNPNGLNLTNTNTPTPTITAPAQTKERVIDHAELAKVQAS